MKLWRVLGMAALLVQGSAFAQTFDRNHSVATFDSGFGGFFTAKEIEKSAKKLETQGHGAFNIQHFGDTRNAPYGEKTPEQIAQFTAAGILTAFKKGAGEVYIACNTASTQFESVKEILRKEDASYPNRIHSIIEVSVNEVMKTVSAELKKRDQVNVAILATPATVRTENYPRYLAKALGVDYVRAQYQVLPQPRWSTQGQTTIESVVTKTELALGSKKKVTIYQMAPANWVDMIERGASDSEKRQAVFADLKMLTGAIQEPVTFDVVGEFCTHYPVFDSLIQEAMKSYQRATAKAPFIVQGPLMAKLFERNFLDSKNKKVAYQTQPPKIYISGDNQAATSALAAKVFPNDPVTTVEKAVFEPVQ